VPISNICVNTSPASGKDRRGLLDTSERAKGFALRIIRRSDWGAVTPRGRDPLPAPNAHGVAVHYTGMDADEQAEHAKCGGRVRAMQRFHMETNGWLDIAYCVDEETEVLTHRGFRRYTELDEGDLVLTLDHEAGRSEWQPLLGINVFDARPRPMILLEGASHSSLTTLDHRWPVERYVRRFKTRIREPGSKRRIHRTLSAERIKRFATTSELRYFDRIPAAARCKSLPTRATYDDAFVELLAWFWTEGNIRLSRGRPTTGLAIYQSHEANPAYVDRIRRCLLALYGPACERLRKQGDIVPRWRESRNGHKTEFFLNHVAGREVLRHSPGKVVSPELIRTLTAEQLALFIETSIDGDGYRNPGGTRVVNQKIADRLNPLQAACALLGLRTTLKPPLAAYPANGSSLSIWKRGSGAYISPGPATGAKCRFRRQEVLHEGSVWCPTTSNGTWFARRRGTTYFTGNSHVVCRHGYVFVGRGFGIRTAANGTTAANDHYFAICFLGNDSEGRADLTRPARRALGELIREYQRRYPRALRVRPHSAFVATACPGRELLAYIDRRGWTQSRPALARLLRV
jgi:hypothetical protein